MALALRALPRRLLLLHQPLHHSMPLSSSPPDPRELLRIERILSTPTSSTTPPPQRQGGPRPAAAATSSLHETAGLTAAESASLLRRGLPTSAKQPHHHHHHRHRQLRDELRGLRLGERDIRAALASDAGGLLLSMSPGEPSRLVGLVRGELRCRAAVRDRVLAGGALAAAVAARRRVELLHARGLTRRDALRVLAAEPRAILYGLEDVERKVDFLVSRMGFEIGWLVQYPEFLGVNLERRIVPRHNVVEHLRSIGGLGDPIEMKHYVRFSRQRFYNIFVKPYPECERIFGGIVREKEEVRRWRHPVGLWKLFKPAKYESTKEDVNNMKMVMKSLH
ncbi:transcription termination factor MTERF15, mitochondrial-like [Oryza glaberrima]|uniref:transcription termination factor MTERF15, mitochondrial-like n=1 Tax=Oryza glaberrima TaxID=4538 RepID=UPI00224C2F7C|nr:transcription termination factor MTERF15, mitochondrial-like [Oryza glaberrima]XP_052138262.1 transcription termination factor MTERF15, mitochondrial-like [Oryza glaberrima]